MDKISKVLTIFIAIVTVILIAFVAGCVDDKSTIADGQTGDVQNRVHMAENYIIQNSMHVVDANSIRVKEVHVEISEGYKTSDVYMTNVVLSFKERGVERVSRVIVDSSNKITYADIDGVLLY